mgnify:CR=1 FL=1
MHRFLDDDEPLAPMKRTTVISVFLVLLLSIVGGLSWYLREAGLDTVFYLSGLWILSVVAVLLAGNFSLIKILNVALPWRSYTVWRFVIQLFSSLIFSLTCINATYYLFKINFTDLPPTNDQFMLLNIYGLLFLVPVVSLQMGVFLLNRWRETYRNAEQLKRETMRAQLQSLREHIDPHFLFNNLNILDSLIDEKNTDAHAFLESFAEVYRYVLLAKKQELVRLRDELEFVDAYIFMLQKRFGHHLNFHQSLEAVDDYLIPPLSLQLLIENAVKHNQISSEHGLDIFLSTEEDTYLVVRNTYRPLATPAKNSTKTGLPNIERRYRFYSDLPVQIANDGDFFTVKIPLLQADH